jgi:hypothetical protein
MRLNSAANSFPKVLNSEGWAFHKVIVASNELLAPRPYAAHSTSLQVAAPPPTGQMDDPIRTARGTFVKEVS